MAAGRKDRKKSPQKKGNSPKKIARRRVPQEIGIEEVKRMVKAPSDYEDVARKFADALEHTSFRGTVSPRKLRSLVARGARLAQRAAAAQMAATTVDRRRMAQASEA